MLDKQRRDKWPASEHVWSIQPAMTFAPEGLILGAGTVVLQIDGPRRLQSLRGREAQVLAFLSAFHGNPVACRVLGNIERAAKAWNEGDDCLAYVHLMHAGLSPPKDFRSGAYRLAMAELALKHGALPCAVFNALQLDARYIDAIEKAYNPAEPRVPAGSGKTSGEWTDGAAASADGAASTGVNDAAAGGGSQESSLLARMPLATASFLSELNATQVAGLGAYASRLLGPVGAAVATFGLLFIPSRNDVHVEGEVSEIPGLRYSWNRDETALHLTYNDSGGGQRTFTAQRDEDLFRDTRGRVIGRVLSDANVAIDAAAVSPDLVDDDEPRLCPAPGPDKAGNELGRAYENYVKSIVNPYPRTTPSGFGFQLPNPEDAGKLVYYDDCQRETGMMIEAKGPSYSGLLSFPEAMQSIVYEWLDESQRQIAASDGRHIRWYFAEWEAKLFAEELFAQAKDGREKIEVEYLPWSKTKKLKLSLFPSNSLDRALFLIPEPSLRRSLR